MSKSICLIDIWISAMRRVSARVSGPITADIDVGLAFDQLSRNPEQYRAEWRRGKPPCHLADRRGRATDASRWSPEWTASLKSWNGETGTDLEIVGDLPAGLLVLALKSLVEVESEARVPVGGDAAEDETPGPRQVAG